MSSGLMNVNDIELSTIATKSNFQPNAQPNAVQPPSSSEIVAATPSDDPTAVAEQNNLLAPACALTAGSGIPGMATAPACIVFHKRMPLQQQEVWISQFSPADVTYAIPPNCTKVGRAATT